MRCAILALALFACAGSEAVTHSAVRYTNAEQHYSVDQPDGWTVGLERGAARFSPADKVKARHAVVIRSALRPRELVEGKPTTDEDVIAATSKVLTSLPQAKLEDKTVLPSGGLAGVRFTVTFTPIRSSTRYRRTQVTLFGHNRLFHVIYVAPEADVVDEDVLKQMVSTLDEEG